MWLVALIGCKGKSVGPKPPDMASLRAELKRYRFSGPTAGVLEKLKAAARTAEGVEAAEAHFLLGRVVLDWIMAAQFKKDSDLLGKLVSRLGFSKDCPTGSGLNKVRCRQALLSWVEKRFRAAARAESGKDDQEEGCCGVGGRTGGGAPKCAGAGCERVPRSTR